jgi:hypothetical protein
MINAIDEMTILKDAATALQEHDRQRQALKTSEDALRAIDYLRDELNDLGDEIEDLHALVAAQ